MIQQLEPSQFSSARHLFNHIAKHQPMCSAVLEGVYPGKIFVDNQENPRSALLTTFIESEQHSLWGFLVGEPQNKDFNSDLNRAIYNRQIISTETPVVLLTCDPDDWDGQMSVVMSPRPPIWMPRWHFVCHQINYDWRKNLPEGFTIARLRTDMLEERAFELPGDVCTTLEKWAAAKHEQFADYGFMTVDHTGQSPIVASWATVDFIAGGMGDLGFFTQPAYRRRGLGTIAAAAALEHGLANGLSQINWTMEWDNYKATGNASNVVSDSVLLDSVPPVLSSV
jgi:GNAT superfamily N-acetyltransferase